MLDDSYNSIIKKIGNVSVHQTNSKHSRKVAILLIYDKPTGSIGEISEFIKTHLPVQKAIVREYNAQLSNDPIISFI